MSQASLFESPREARIDPRKHARFSATLKEMGLEKTEFRIVGVIGDSVVIHPDDLAKPLTAPFALRRDLVQFVES